MNFRIYLAFFLLFITTSGYTTKNINVVSLSPSLTKMIYLLESQDNLVGCTEFCDIPEEDEKNIVASQMNVNVEKILSISPDLVITTKLTSARYIETLKKTGVNTRVLGTPESFVELCDQFIKIGKLIGKEDLAVSIIEQQKSRLARLQQKIPDNDNPEIFMQLGVKPLFTVIPGTFMNDYINLSGGVNIASDLTKGTITRETVLTRDPDVIIIVLMGMVGEEEKQNWKSYSGLRAAEKDKIFMIDEDKACSPTPVTFVDTVEEIIDLMYN